MATTEQAAYMAGALDGEGHIAITKAGVDNAQWRKSPRYAFVMTVTNTNKAWLEQLQQWFGGIVKSQNKARDGRRRECYMLRFRSEEILRVLAEVSPYLIIKRRHAQVAQRHFELNAIRRHRFQSGEPVDLQIIAEQESLYTELRSLNLSRPHADQSWRPVGATCSVEDCGRKHYGRGYCWKHYRKYIIRGGPAFYEKKCATCGRDFVARRSDAECCSKACGDKKYYGQNAERIKAQVAAYKARKMQEQT